MGTASNKLVIAGVNFKKTALDIRNKFALTTEQIKRIYSDTTGRNPVDFFILSTCNRTEVYSTTGDAFAVLNLLVANSEADLNETAQHTFTKTGDEAIIHLFRVASGLDSQILGDYEIVCQLKNAFNLAKSYHKISGLMEKLVNWALQVSKEVKSQTMLSDGTTSVSYAVIQRLKQLVGSKTDIRICLMGLGKIGSLTLKNLSHYLPQSRVTIINRDHAKAELAASAFTVDCVPFEARHGILANTDALIVATASESPLISKADIDGSSIKFIFDLSVPSNVSSEVAALTGIRVFTIDELSKTVNELIEARHFEVPVAEKIIDEHFMGFKQWEMRRKLYAIPVERETAPPQRMVA